MKRATIGPVATGLLRQIGNLMPDDLSDRDKTILVVEDIQSTEWASLTFVGERHVLALRIDGDSAKVAAARAAIERSLADLELAVPGHFIAEIGAVSHRQHATARPGDTGRSFRVEALVLRD